MTDLILLTSPGCHMCGHGREVLDRLGVPWREVSTSSPQGQVLEVSAPPIRPVLYADGRVIGYGRLSERRLRKQLGSTARAA